MLKVIIMAAGEGTRMKSNISKVLHKINNKEIVRYVYDASKIKDSKTIIISGKNTKIIQEMFDNDIVIEQKIGEDEAVFVPLGLWHNITNRGSVPLKLYTIYASPDHVPGTVHGTQEDAESDPNE